MVARLPVVTVDVAGKSLFCIKALQLACSPVEVKMELLPEMFDRFAIENNMGLGQNCCRAKWAEFLPVILEAMRGYLLPRPAFERRNCAMVER